MTKGQAISILKNAMYCGDYADLGNIRDAIKHLETPDETKEYINQLNAEVKRLVGIVNFLTAKMRENGIEAEFDTETYVLQIDPRIV